LGVSVAWFDSGGDVQSTYLNLGHLPSLFFPRHSTDDVRGVVAAAHGTERVFYFNSTFDLERLARWDLLPLWPTRKNLYDAQPMARMVMPFDRKERCNLANVARKTIGPLPDGAAKMKKKRKQLAQFPAEAVSGYARTDAEFTLGAGLHLLDAFDREYDGDRLLLEREAAFLLLLTRMQLAGVGLNVPWVEEKARSLRVKMEATGLALRDKYGIQDPGSKTELVAFFRAEGATIPQTEKGNDKLDMGVLETISHPAAELIVIWRQCAKAIGTWCQGFLDAVAKDGRIHPRFHSAGTISGRLSCTDPALQAVPMSDRGRAFGSMAGIFTAANGYELWAGDYSQAELRLATMYAGCLDMAAILASGEDVHAQSAQRMWPNREITQEYRQFGKTLNYTLIYGGGVNAICEACGIGEDGARELKARHKKAFPALHAMLQIASRAWKDRGHTRLVSGRKRYMGSNEHGYAAFNQVIQGGVAEIIKDAMLTLDTAITQIGGRIVLQIYDSVEIEVPASRRRECCDALREAMTGACPAWLVARTDPHRIALTVDIERWEAG